MRSIIEKVAYELLIWFLVSLVMSWPFMLLMGVLHSEEPSVSTLGWQDSFALTFIFALLSALLRFGWGNILRKKKSS